MGLRANINYKILLTLKSAKNYFYYFGSRNFFNRKIVSFRGVHPDFFVKLDFEIAVDQQTRARTFGGGGVPDSGCPRDSHAHIWSIFGPILPNHLNMLKTIRWGALLVATSL